MAGLAEDQHEPGNQLRLKWRGFLNSTIKKQLVLQEPGSPYSWDWWVLPSRNLDEKDRTFYLSCEGKPVHSAALEVRVQDVLTSCVVDTDK